MGHSKLCWTGTDNPDEALAAAQHNAMGGQGGA